MNGDQLDGPLQVAVIPKGIERYLFLWTRRERWRVIQTAHRWAQDPELSFTDQDFAALVESLRIRDPSP